MSLGCTLILVVMLTAEDPLADARAAFARGEYDRAEALALAGAQPPRMGAALYLVGLSRFRAGRTAEALEAIDAASRAADRPDPGPWQYNRGACLYQLGRFEEAEASFTEAAALTPSLASVALVNAGFAALDGGAPERAKALASRARAAGSGRELDLVEDLERHIAGATDAGPSTPDDRAAEDYRRGLAAYDAGRFREAFESFQRAAAGDPSAGRYRLMVGAAELKLGRRSEARAELEQALRLVLDTSEAEAARDHLDASSFGLAARGRGWEAQLRAGSGFDSNVLQSGLVGSQERAPIASGQVSSTVASGTLGLAYRWRAREELFAELAYGLDELAYLATAASDYSLQQHQLTGGLEWSVLRRLRLGAFAGGQLAFTGISSFRGLQAAATGGGWVAFDETGRTATRVDFGFTRKAALLPEFSFLTGNRVDALVSQELRLGGLTLDLSYRYRDERIGTLTQSAQFAPPSLCSAGCIQQYVIPFGYSSNTLGLSARAAPASRLRLGLAGGLEWRDHRGDSFLSVTSPDGSTRELDRRQRQDRRVFVTLLTVVRLWRGLEVTLRYDLVVNRSNVDNHSSEPPGDSCGPPAFRCHQLDYDDKNYTKHAFTLETGYVW
jgi:tetratricopeptide (TPR) repeat protein